MGRDKSKLGMAVPAAIVLFSVLIMAAIIAFNIAIHTVEMSRMQSLGIYSLEHINKAIIYCLANPQSSAEVMVSLSADENIEFAENTISFTSKNRAEKSLLETLRSQSNQYEIMIKAEIKDLGNGISISYKRILPEGSEEWRKIRFAPVKITQGRYKIIFLSTSFTDIKVAIIQL
ncbi:MAG: hypothetical protein ABIK75_07000 [candidate division WOR-3 bacterium]